MEAPSTTLQDDVDDILARPLARLATARDIPRLYGRVRLTVGGVARPLCSSAHELLRELARVFGEPDTVVVELADQEEMVRVLGRTCTKESTRFVLKTINQNIIRQRSGRVSAPLT